VIKKAAPISASKANLTKVKALRPKALDDLSDIAGIGSLVPRSRITFAANPKNIAYFSRGLFLLSIP